jgi:hypothetical protein
MNQKKVMISGLAYNSSFSKFFRVGVDFDMKNLGNYAAQGWIVTGIKGIYYILEKKEPEKVDYAIDYQDQPSDEYFEMNDAKGWNKVASIDYIHLFKAKAGTTPLHTSINSKISIIERERKRYVGFTKITLPAFLITVLLNALVEPGSTFVAILFLIGLLVTGITLIYSLFPMIGYTRQLSNLKKKKI